MTTGGRFRGDRVKGADYFDDKMTDNAHAGIFTGFDGLEDYDNVAVHPMQDGVNVSMHCRACNKQCNVLLEWPELFIAANAPETGVKPPGWEYSNVNKALYPDLKCQCGATAAPIVTPDWAGRQIQGALQSGLLTEEQLRRDPRVQQVNTIVRQRQQGQRHF